MAPILTWGPAGLLVAGLGLISAPPPVSDAAILHKHRHRHLHRNAALEDDLQLLGIQSTPLIDPKAIPRAVPEDDLPSVGTLTTRFGHYSVGTPYISSPLGEEEVGEAPTAAFDNIAHRTRPLIRSSGGGTPPQPYPPNGPVKVAAAGLFERLASRTQPLVRSSGGGIPPQPYPPNKLIAYSSRVSDSAIIFFLAAVGFFFVSLIWNLYVRYGWARDQAKETDMSAVGAMQLTFLPGESRGKDKSRGKVRHSPGGWLRAANMAPAPVSAV